MIDRHDFRDHRMEAARETCDRYSPARSWVIVPEEPKVPAVVWQAMAWIAGLGVLFVVLPSLVRMVVA